MTVKSVRVAIADDHAIIRLGLRGLFTSAEDIELVSEAHDGASALEFAKEKKPDVLLLDVSMPGEGGLEVARQICRLSPMTQVILLTMHAEREVLRQALEAGVAGYLLKDDPPDEVLNAIRKVASGHQHFSPSVSHLLVGEVARSREPVRREPFDTLTKREREVLRLLAEGYTNKDVANALSISVKTAEAHRANLYVKLDCHSIAELVKIALRHKLTQL